MRQQRLEGPDRRMRLHLKNRRKSMNINVVKNAVDQGVPDGDAGKTNVST